jgi:hypothetical protein
MSLGFPSCNTMPVGNTGAQRGEQLLTRISSRRHSNVVLQRRAACQRRRQQDPDRQQMRLGGEEGSLDRTGPGPRRRAWDPLPRGISEEQYQYRQGLLQPCGRHQEAPSGQREDRPAERGRRQRRGQGRVRKVRTVLLRGQWEWRLAGSNCFLFNAPLATGTWGWRFP